MKSNKLDIKIIDFIIKNQIDNLGKFDNQFFKTNKNTFIQFIKLLIKNSDKQKNGVIFFEEKLHEIAILSEFCDEYNLFDNHIIVCVLLFLNFISTKNNNYIKIKNLNLFCYINKRIKFDRIIIDKFYFTEEKKLLKFINDRK